MYKLYSTIQLILTRRFVAVSIVLLFGGALAVSMSVSSQSTTIVKRVSVNSAGGQANNMSTRNDINDDGRYIVFASLASNLVDGDTNTFKDIFLQDLLEGTTVLISKNDGGEQGDGESDAPVISGDGRYIAYESYATNLVDNDTNGKNDIFLYDRESDTTTRVSIGDGEEQSNDHSFYPAISGDGQVVAFQSAASNLVTGDTNGYRDIFVRDHIAGTTERASISVTNEETNGDNLHPSLSEDGRFVAFTSASDNLIPYVPEGLLGGSCSCSGGALTADSCENSYAVCNVDACSCVLRYVPVDDNNVSDIFLRDRVNQTTELISVDSLGNKANGGSAFPDIDDDGSYIAYESVASNLVSGDTNGVRDVFVFNRQLGETTIVSTATDGTRANNSSGDGVDEQSIAISGDGQFVVFKSRATNLVSDDTNGQVDVFVHHQRESFITTRISLTENGTEANSYSYYPSISSDGQYIVYYSYATDLVSGDTNGYGDIFVYNQDAQSTTPTPSTTPGATNTPVPTGEALPTPNPITVTLPQRTQYPTEVDMQTPAGTATIRCEQVTTGGTVTLSTLNTPPGQLDSTLTILKTNYDITTSVLKCDLITVCLPYSEAEVSTALLTEDELRLYHFTGNQWSDITSYNDVEGNRICGQVNEFSPFVIGNTNYVPTPTVNPNATLTPVPPNGSTPTPTVMLPKSGTVGTTLWGALMLVLFVGAGVFLIL